MPIRLVTAIVTVNDETVGVVPGSVSMVEGDGDFTVSAVSVGARVEQVISQDLESARGQVKFRIPMTVENLEITRDWKQLINANVVQLSGSNADGTFDRTFSQAIMTTDPEKTFGSDADIEVIFESNTAI
jgi:hypothetical protein